jgi:RNA polymerase sigma-70 factor (ECF subfamily)
MNFADASDGELLQLASAGSEEAFVTLYRRWQGNIYRFALRVSGSASTAEDVTQEVFLCVIKGGGRFDPALGSFSSYLYGIARHRVLRKVTRERIFASFLNGTGGEHAEHSPAAPSDPLGDLTRRESVAALRNAVAALPLRYREVIVLCELQELSYADAARVVRCPEGTIRSRLHRARGLLLEKLRADRRRHNRDSRIEAARCPL